jgi:hypothetical protein
MHPLNPDTVEPLRGKLDRAIAVVEDLPIRHVYQESTRSVD